MLGLYRGDRWAIVAGGGPGFEERDADFEVGLDGLAEVAEVLGVVAPLNGAVGEDGNGEAIAHAADVKAVGAEEEFELLDFGRKAAEDRGDVGEEGFGLVDLELSFGGVEPGDRAAVD